MLSSVSLLTGMALIAAVLVAFGFLDRGPGDTSSFESTSASAPRPSASPHGSPGASVTAITTSPGPTTPAGSPPPGIDDLSADPPDLPRYPGSLVIADERGVDGSVHWMLLRYRALADLDSVRTHYRAAFRQQGWFVGEVEFEDDGWRFVANRGSREVVVEIAPDDPDVLVTAWISDSIQHATLEPTQRPDRTPRPGRTPQPPRDEDEDDDEDDDDGDDDGDEVD